MCLPIDVTPEEFTAGFRRTMIENPEGWLGEPAQIPAVICPVPPFGRLTKMDDGFGRTMYRLEVYGVLSVGPFAAPPEWIPVSFPDFEYDALRANENAAAWINARLPKNIDPRMPPPLDSIG
jgi:hypothetical protein